MQSHPIKFKCGHERALPLDETGKALKKRIKRLEKGSCPACVRFKLNVALMAIERGRDER